MATAWRGFPLPAAKKGGRHQKVTYACLMATSHILRTLKVEQQILDAVHRRRHREAELREASSGATLVAIGWLLATLYSLLTHQLPI
jgi:heme exporter protein D